MNITEQCVVSLTWTLKDSLGDELDTLDEPIEFMVGGQDLLEKIETALQGLRAGSTVNLHLEPEDAFGDFNDKLLFLEPRNLFPQELEEGMAFEGLPAGCNPSAPADTVYFVTDIYPDHVVLDANHPLAGISLELSLRVHEVREATEQEVGSGTLGTGFFKLQTSSKDAPPQAVKPHLH